MQEIAKTEFYMLLIDETKKRVYNIVFGAWGERPEVSQVLQDWEKVFNLISEGYTMLTDARQFRLISAGWAATTIKIRQRLIQAGITKIAEILPENSLLKVQFGKASERAGVKTKVFSSRKEAEIWLDSSEL